MGIPEAVPQAGGSYLRDDTTGALIKTEGAGVESAVSTSMMSEPAPQLSTAIQSGVNHVTL
jgi:hypothetical protein